MWSRWSDTCKRSHTSGARRESVWSQRQGASPPSAYGVMRMAAVLPPLPLPPPPPQPPSCRQLCGVQATDAREAHYNQCALHLNALSSTPSGPPASRSGAHMLAVGGANTWLSCASWQRLAVKHDLPHVSLRQLRPKGRLQHPPRLVVLKLLAAVALVRGVQGRQAPPLGGRHRVRDLGNLQGWGWGGGLSGWGLGGRG